MKKRFPLFATLFTLLAIALLCGLGKWQLDRLAWKTGILKKLETEYAKDAENIFLSPAGLSQNFDYKRGTLRGVYDYSKQIMVGPRVYDLLPGFQVLTPLTLEDGSSIIVNRGWVPHEWTPADEIVKGPGEIVSVTGLVRKPQDHNPFSPPNAPAKNQWYYSSPSEIAAAKNIGNIHAYVLYREGLESGDYPIPQTARPQIENNHLYYAIFWFTMAGVLLVIYILRFIRSI